MRKKVIYKVVLLTLFLLGLLPALYRPVRPTAAAAGGGGDPYGEFPYGEIQRISGDADTFGYAIDADGDLMVVGAGSADVGGNAGQGMAYIYQRDPVSGHWSEIKQLLAGDGAAGDGFGWSVAISGDTVTVGAPYASIGAVSHGVAYVFERDAGGVDNWGEVKKIVPDTSQTLGGVGEDVALAGDTLIVGAPRTTIGSSPVVKTHQGATFIFQRDEGGANNWGQVAELVASDGDREDYLGISVAISGDTLVTGAWRADVDGETNAGAAYIFERTPLDGGNWNEVAKLTASDGTDNDLFGKMVDIDGDRVIVGAASVEMGTVFQVGAAYVYERDADGADQWGEVAKLMAPDGMTEDYFGQGVAVQSDTLFVGADGADVNGTEDAGAVYVFSQAQGGGWEFAQKLGAAQAFVNDRLGREIVPAGDQLLIGHDSGSFRDGVVVFGPLPFQVQLPLVRSD